MEGLLDQRRYLIPFRSMLLPQIFCDTLVIGGGVAGLRAAAEAARFGEVILLAKGPFGESNTAWAQGGIAAVLREDDSFESHVRDTLDAGAGLCDRSVVDLVVREGAERVRELIGWGARFDEGADGTLDAGMEGGHSGRRVFHAGGDATGREIERVLLERARQTERLRVFGDCFALDLLTPSAQAGSPVVGAITYHPKFRLQIIWAKSVVLASGGAGQLYRETSNPPGATADGLAMAYRAGATMRDMALVQFHPTVLYLPGAARSLISEAVRGEGALLLDAGGNRFMPEVDERAELAPRDVVSRAIVRRIAKQGGKHVWLDCRSIDGFGQRFPGIDKLLRKFDLDASRDLIPVHPAAHYTIGGVETDLDGATDVGGLWAAGEASCSGLHGANRLASNSLLEGLVFGARAGKAAGVAAASGNGGGPHGIVSDIRPSVHGELDLSDVRSSLRSAMWKNVGLVRTGAKLSDAVDMFDFWGRYTLDKIFDEPEGWETQNLLQIGALVARSARWREESRGCHVREDFPATEPSFAAHDLWKRGRDEALGVPVEAGEPASGTPMRT